MESPPFKGSAEPVDAGVLEPGVVEVDLQFPCVRRQALPGVLKKDALEFCCLLWREGREEHRSAEFSGAGT